MGKKKEILIIKRNGEKEPFDVDKLRYSLQKSKADPEIIEAIVQDVRNFLHEGITTKVIYNRAFNLLEKKSHPHAARYKLKNAIYELGPTGYPFERYISAILGSEGFRTRVGVKVRGRCVEHEVDVVAEKKDRHYMVECKFHSEQEFLCHIRIPLYIRSRFVDVEENWQKIKGHENKFHQGWIFTNTRFSKDAMQYGKCAGLMLVGWDYPKGESLKERIDRSGMHPVTSLTTLSDKEKQQLLDRNAVLCQDLCDQPDLLTKIGIHHDRQKKILDEARSLCEKIE